MGYAAVDPFDGYEDDFPLRADADPHVLSDEEVEAMIARGSLGGEDPEEGVADPAWAQDSFFGDTASPTGPVSSVPVVADPPVERPKAPRRPRKQKTQTPQEEPAPVKQGREKHLYVNLEEGTLENGEPFWYQVGEDITAYTPSDALRRLWITAGKPESIPGGRIVLKDSLRVREITIETVEREPVRRIVIS